MINWSEKQKQVIDARNSNLLVSAAAGSGKTAVLVERIISRIADDGVSLDEMIIMTFTKAAAAEMRERVEHALKERLKKEPGNAHIRLQLAILSRARISTIDSICQGLIKQYYQYLDIDPGFRVADEGELRVIQSDILDELLLEKFEEASPDFMCLVDTYQEKGSDKRIAALILKLFEYSQSQTFPRAYLQRLLEECSREAAGDYLDTMWFRRVLRTAQDSIMEHVRLLDIALEICNETDGPFKYAGDIEVCRNMALDIMAKEDYPTLFAYLENVSFARIPTITAKDGVDPTKKELVKNIRTEFKEYVTDKLRDKYFLLSPELFSESVMGGAAINKTIIELTMEFLRCFEARKRDANIVDFSDMEHLALKLLYEKDEEGARPSEIADDLAKQLKEIMIDEYQDSNAVQDALLNALSAERFGRPDIFMVGDVKQSIYRFRQADPEIFIGKYNTYQDEGEHVKIELNSNYRSRHEVVDSVNAVFDKVMQRQLGGVEYDKNSRLNAGAAYLENLIMDEEGGVISADKTEILISDPYQNKNEESEQNLEGFDDPNSEEQEYIMIANRINELIDPADPKKSIHVQDKENDKTILRPARYSDITILLRAAKGHADTLVDILEQNGIPAYFKNTEGYFSTFEVEVMLSFLSVIDNPHQDIPLVAVMRSPIYHFSDEELAGIRSRFRENIIDENEKPDRTPDFWDAVRFSAKTDKKAEAFVESVFEYRKAAGIIPVHMLINRIYQETGYYHYVSAMPLGKTRKKNLDTLMEKAESYSKTGLHGLFNFTRYIEALKKNSFDFGEAGESSENDNIVRIMTIHGSKGLEYPIVFLARTASSSRGSDEEEGILVDSRLGVASDYLDLSSNVKYPGLKKTIIKLKNKEEDIGEQLRLLYVAMTRAKEKLIITGSKSSTKNKTAEEMIDFIRSSGETLSGATRGGKIPVQSIFSYDSYLDWILLAMGMREDLFELKMFTMNDLAAREVEAVRKDEEVFEKLEKIRSSEEGYTKEDEHYIQELKTLFHTPYSHFAETMLKPKISVSEIKHEHMDEIEMDDVAEVSDQWLDIENSVHQGVSFGALRGTAFHRAMELLCYKESFEDELAYLKNCGLMKEEELEILNITDVQQFWKSELGRRFHAAYHAGRLKREQHFMVGIPACELKESQESDELQLLQGIIDAYIEEEDNSITLVDYKTDKVNSAEELMERYKVQLDLYSRALEQLTEKTVKQRIIYSTFLKQQIMV